ncbi:MULTISPECIES: hypothetical protein [unclassified Streptomyces]|uniref:hypothetical protein n=1 Tax=unclassified Streptomyces TaxID=2593676 RepID=UPI0033E3F18E
MRVLTASAVGGPRTERVAELVQLTDQAAHRAIVEPEPDLTDKASDRSALRQPCLVTTLVFAAVTPVLCTVASVDNPSLTVGLLSVTVTGLGMTGLFFIPAACSRRLPNVTHRRSRRVTVPGEADPR